MEVVQLAHDKQPFLAAVAPRREYMHQVLTHMSLVAWGASTYHDTWGPQHGYLTLVANDRALRKIARHKLGICITTCDWSRKTTPWDDPQLDAIVESLAQRALHEPNGSLVALVMLSTGTCLAGVIPKEVVRMFPKGNNNVIRHALNMASHIKHIEANPDNCNEMMSMWSMECAGCFRPLADDHERRKLCTGCRSVFYCSAQCQKKAWPVHKLWCKCVKLP